jgi:two-component system response regulator
MNSKTFPVLIVEDSLADLELTLRELKRCNACGDIAVVRDGAEALEFVFCEGQFAGRVVEKQPRVVLLDLKLPLVDGLEVLRRIRADFRTLGLPVIIVTASNSEDDLAEAHKLGVSGYLLKPVEAEQLAAAIRTLSRVIRSAEAEITRTSMELFGGQNGKQHSHS